MKLKINALTGTVFAACLSFAVTGCSQSGSSEQTEGLKQRVADLERENALLKTTISSLQTQQTDLVKSVASSTLKSVFKEPEVHTESSDKAVSACISGKTFADLSDVPTKYMITDLCKLGVFDGMGQNFEPFKPISRGQYVSWLFKAHNAIEPPAKQIRLAPGTPAKFKDLPASNPAYQYAQALSNAGYSVGYEDGTFRPDQPITREEMIGMKVGVDTGKNLEPYRGQMAFVWKFSDSKEVDERFTGYIHQDFYISGPNGSNIQRAFGQIGTFKPKAPVTRCEAAGTLWQFGQFGHQGGTAPGALKNETAHG